MANPNEITKETYQDPAFVQKFIAKHNPRKIKPLVEEFVTLIPEKKVLDLGCGPGIHSGYFADLGIEVTGLDYSDEMITAAKKHNQKRDQASFMVGDIKKVADYFPNETFDAIWASASLVHFDKKEVPTILEQLNTITKPKGVFYISLKGGHGRELVNEEAFSKGAERVFSFWAKEELEKILLEAGLTPFRYEEKQGRVFQGKQTQWHVFYCRK